ncbi:MAG TPA: hypothetical protein VK211_00730 [Kamptonema sp.]|nr:hypothetical protein [Kamptonema sp.]
MANTKTGGQKSAAFKIGCTWQEYSQKRQSGFNWCSVCRTWMPLAFFNNDANSVDGKCNKCKSCSRAIDRQRYKPVPLDQQKPRGFAPHPPRDGDKQQARNRVNREVRKGKLPRAQTVPCTDCGHIGSDRLHEYDHYLGYAAINHLAVQCVCVPCHNKREQRRRSNDE